MVNCKSLFAIFITFDHQVCAQHLQVLQLLVFRFICDEVTARHDLKVIRSISEFIDLVTIVYECLFHRSWATTLPQTGSVVSLLLMMERACHLFRCTSSLLRILWRFRANCFYFLCKGRLGYNGLATKLRILSMQPNGNIRNHLVANPQYVFFG